ncbi:hypothetical protein MOQ72_06195 [Saccharopolyspora sp. K220]|uniref:hypothetical protein n=1 Tax=Saccharopolyspora soli TaxID=2926618 RepID=UPI001F570FA2|nr:hypothetical protein [Saccharopolyspora soli]MCI2417008.1 hypothetical protein [Saccharopolyspora soli]
MTSPQNPWQHAPNPPQFAPQPGFAGGYPPQFAGPKPPGAVAFASLLGIAVPLLSAVLSVVSLALMFVQIGEYLSSMWGVVAWNTSFTFSAVVLSVLWVVFSLRMRAGRGWARTTLAILAVLWLLYDLYSIVMFFVNTGGDLGMVIRYPTMLIGVVQMLLVFVTTVLFLVLVFLKPSNDYFKLMRGR